MRRFIALFTVVLVSLLVAGPGEAQHRSYLKDMGARTYSDSVAWSNGQGIGAGGYTDTLLGSETDTSSSFRLDNIQSLGAIFIVDMQQGAASGVDTAAVVSCSLQVSIDGSNWVSLKNEPVFTHSGSADPAGNVMVVWYSEAAMADTSVGDADVAGAASMAYVDAARLGRLVLVSTQDNNDTAYVKVHMHREYGE